MYELVSANLGRTISDYCAMHFHLVPIDTHQQFPGACRSALGASNWSVKSFSSTKTQPASNVMRIHVSLNCGSCKYALNHAKCSWFERGRCGAAYNGPAVCGTWTGHDGEHF